METQSAMLSLQERYDAAHEKLSQLGLQKGQLTHEIMVKSQRAKNTRQYILQPQSCDVTSNNFLNYPILDYWELRDLAFRGLNDEESEKLRNETIIEDNGSIPSERMTAPGTAKLLLLGLKNYFEDIENKRVQLAQINDKVPDARNKVKSLGTEKSVRKCFPSIADWVYPGVPVA